MTTVQIFPGLKKPKGDLYETIVKFIDDNGGKLPLARILEREMMYVPKRVLAFKREFIGRHKVWDKSEDAMLNCGMSNQELSKILNRTSDAIYRRRSLIKNR